MNHLNVLFLLSQPIHEKLLKLNDHRASSSPDNLKAQSFSSDYTGNVAIYQQIVFELIGIPTEQRFWNLKLALNPEDNKMGVGVFTHYPVGFETYYGPLTSEVLSIGLESMGKPGRFICCTLDQSLKLGERESILSSQGTDEQPLSFAWSHYIDSSEKLLIVSDCLHDIENSQWEYLIKGIKSSSEKICIVDAQLLLKKFESEQSLQETLKPLFSK